MAGILLLLLLLVAVLAWLIAPGAQRATADGEEIEPADKAELEAAENEVRDLDVNQRPEDGFEGDDWGPGAAKQ